MPSLIKQPDGSVLWDYDVPVKPKKPAKKTAAADQKNAEES